ncbi:MAG: DUF3540 domain-containing protein [Polyangiaceae bacterium]
MSATPTPTLQTLTLVDDYLGPARVVDASSASPVVELGGRTVRAELALAFPYACAVGDSLLVIGRGERFYVIGVLASNGEVALRFMGDVRIQAVGGKLALEGDEGVRVRGKSIDLVASRVKTLADSIVERANDVYRRVKDTLSEHSGEKRVLVDGSLSTRAESAATTTSGVITMNGKEIHLS